VLTGQLASAVGRRPRVALVVPNFLWCDWDPNSRWAFIPYNLCILAAMIRDRCDVTIIDANRGNMSEDELIGAIKGFAPDIVGITVLMDQYGPAGHHAARLVKQADPAISVVLGGVYATMNTERVLQDPNIDQVVIGEGEYVLRKLVDHFRGAGPPPARGIAYRGADGAVVNLGHADRIVDLDAVPLPAYDLIDYPAYVAELPERRSVDMPPLVPYARILTSRGCPYGCCFCQVEHISGKKFRGRSAENILDEIAWLRRDYGVRSLIFDDDNLFIDKKRALAIFEGMVRRGLRMPWVSIATAAFRLDEELLDAMVASGCEYIDIAIESGCPRVLKELVGKPLKLPQALQIARAARDRGLYVAANFVIGFPTETWDEIRQTIRFAEEIDVDYVKIFAAMPLVNTRLWDLCVKTNSFKRKDLKGESLRWNVGQIETDQFTARDITVLRAYEWDRINFSDPGKRRRTAERMHLSEEELWRIRRSTLSAANHFPEEA
jgi:radical SAM superfamily enzyme YgiQ (UPF0313 family)